MAVLKRHRHLYIYSFKSLGVGSIDNTDQFDKNLNIIFSKPLKKSLGRYFDGLSLENTQA